MAKEKDSHKKKRAKIKDLSLEITRTSTQIRKLPPIPNDLISVSPLDRSMDGGIIDELKAEYEQMKRTFEFELKDTLRQTQSLNSEIAVANKRLKELKIVFLDCIIFVDRNADPEWVDGSL